MIFHHHASIWFISLVAVHPWFQAQFDLTLAALGKYVKKQQEVSDLNQDYVEVW